MLSTDPVTCWSAEDLVATFPGTSVSLWHKALAPKAIGAGVLAKRGKRWFGRRLEIEKWLLDSSSALEPRDRRATTRRGKAAR